MAKKQKTQSGKAVAADIAKALGTVTLDDLAADGPTISTGCHVLDLQLGGGIPAGMITELVGDFSSGKSMLGIQICREAIKAGGVAFYCDSERALNRDWAVAALGIDPKGLVYLEAATLEDMYERILAVIKALGKVTGPPCVLVWDSIAASPPKHILDGDNNAVAAAARVNSEQLPRVLTGLQATGVALVLINQKRMKPMVMFGQKWESMGGQAVRYYSTVRVHMIKLGKEKHGGRIVGTRGMTELIKSRRCKPFSQVKFELLFDHGVQPWSGMLSLFNEAGMLDTSGGVYTFKSDGYKARFTKAQLPELHAELWEHANKERLQMALWPSNNKDEE